MFAKTQMMGLSFSFPDVCLTPAPPSPSPIPVPYPNITLAPTSIPNQFQVLTVGTPTHNMGTTAPMSMGDELGVLTGVASPTFKGPQRNLTGAFTVLVKGMPQTRLTSVSLTNMSNAPGATIVPSQTKVLVLAP